MRAGRLTIEPVRVDEWAVKVAVGGESVLLDADDLDDAILELTQARDAYRLRKMRELLG